MGIGMDEAVASASPPLKRADAGRILARLWTRSAVLS
jgi:hypothetical protein